MPLTCPSCGEENPSRARFCLACGAALAPAADAAEERKVVSVLFIDLVGFTNRSDQADPEDVRATLRPYHARVKREIERFGGTVEKFVGDGVMAVFGAPVAHEDDAERAVRAAFRIVDAIAELNGEQQGLDLAVRGAVGTGEAVVALNARPELGEAIVAADVVNTAARLQNVAPIGGIVIDESTMRVTRQAIDVEALEPTALKGKSEPVPLWRAVQARSRFGVDVEPAARSPLVGREHDLGLLRETYLRTLRESSIQLVTITGEPGVGKTRLVTELRQFVDDREEFVLWRQGRCLPYGEGITFWALGEIVKAQAGILESDPPNEAARKLDVALEAVGARDDEWLRGKLAPLVGLTGAEGGRDEAYVAWRRFLESLAAERPLVLLFEDLHWADDALLEFLDQLVDWSSGVPILVLCTARPELYERVPDWGGGKRNSTTTTLGPLSDDETARLLATLLARAVLPADVQRDLLDRAGGNPLYAEQFARMFAERGDGDIQVPETVQALIAARLDTLAADRKALLQEAAVVGKVFWAGQVATMSGVGDAEVQNVLRDLVRRELIRPARLSTIEGEQEFSFWHLLVRDVAYQQIPRAARARKHLAAAEWIERVAGERLADNADILVHHYDRALELARAAGKVDTARGLEDPLRRFLLIAGERARHLDAGKAYAYAQRALELTPSGHPERAEVLFAAADVTGAVAQTDEAERYYTEALELFEAKGDRRRVGGILSNLASIALGRGNRALANELLAQSLEILEREPPSPELALAYTRTAGTDMLMGNSEAGLVSSERALAFARELGTTREHEPIALQAHGIARLELGDPGGMDDLREGLQVALDTGNGRGAAVAYNNLSHQVWLIEGLHEALRIKDAGIEFGTARGLAVASLWARGERTWLLFDLGAWDELLTEVDVVLTLDREAGSAQASLFARAQQALVLVARGRAAEAARFVPELVRQAHDAADPQVVVPALAASALVHRTLGHAEAALDVVRELEQFTRDRPAWNRLWYAPDAMRIAVAAGELELADRFVDRTALGVRSANSLLSARAIAAEGRGDATSAAKLYGEATEGWQEFGHRLEHAQALLGIGRTGPSDDALRRARELFAELGAVALLESADGLPQTATVAPAGPEAARRAK